VYTDLIYQLSINFPDEYPIKPPEIFFINGCFHPNVFSDGKVCMDIIKDGWKDTCSMRTVLLGIVTLLSEPNTSSPANGYASAIWQRFPDLYREKVHKKYKPPKSFC
jgi:ubiquitin-conjugating enzyme E2 C